MPSYSHEELGFSVALLDGMRVVLELPPTVAFEPDRDWSFQPACVVTAEPRAEAVELDAWVDAGLALQQQRLLALLVIDRQPAETAGHATVRTLSHHVVREHAVTLEQWWLLDATRGWALSASCGTLDYSDVSDWFTHLVSSFEPSSAA